MPRNGCLALAFLIIVGHPALAGDLELKPIALSGGTAAGTGGGLFSSFAGASVSREGEVSFSALSVGGDRPFPTFGFWSDLDGDQMVLSRFGDAAPDLPGAMINFAPISSRFGSRAVNGQVGGAGVTQTNDQVVWAGELGSLAIVAREGTPAPGTGDAPLNSIIGTMNEAGQVMLRGALRTTFPGIDSLNDEAIWLGAPDNPQLIVRDSDLAPGTNGFRYRSLESAYLQESGDVTFMAAVTDAQPRGSGFEFNWGIWNHSNNATAPVALRGDAAPGTTGNFGYFETLRSNGQGGIALVADLESGLGTRGDGVEGLWAGTASGVDLIALGRTDAPGTGSATPAQFDQFLDPRMNADGAILFEGILGHRAGPNSVGGTNDQGIWVASNSALELIAREGATAPGELAGKFESFQITGLNDSGDAYFTASLRDAQLNPLGNGLWFYDSSLAELLPVAQTGDVFDVNDDPFTEDLREVLEVGGTVNDFGLAALHLTFTDGTSGVFTLQVPSPGWMPLALGSAPILLARRRT